MRRTSPKGMESLRRRISHNLARMRAERGIGLEELAALAVVSSRDLQRIEAGQGNMTVTTLARLADALSVDPAELLTPINSDMKK